MEEVEEGEEIEIEVTRGGEALVFAVVPEVLEGWGLPGRISIRMRDMADRLRDQYRDIEWDAQWEAPRVDLDEMGDLFRGYGELSREWLPGGAHGLELVRTQPRARRLFRHGRGGARRRRGPTIPRWDCAPATS